MTTTSSSVPPPPSSLPSATIISISGVGKGKVKGEKERWSAACLDRGYSPVPVMLMWGQGKLGLSPDEFNVLLQIISHWWFGGTDPYVSKERIAKRMGKHPRTIQAYLTKLETKGFIKRVKRLKANKAQDANAYDLSGLVKKLEELAPEFKKVADQNKLRRSKVERPAG